MIGVFRNLHKFRRSFASIFKFRRVSTMASSTESEAVSLGAFTTIINEIIYNPLYLLVVVIIVWLLYKILKSQFGKVYMEPPAPELPKLRKDMTVAELRQFDGTQVDGRVLVAVNGWIFDVTRGRRFYGPGEYFLRQLFINSGDSVWVIIITE